MDILLSRFLKASDYPKWLKRDLWTLREGLCLLLGVEVRPGEFGTTQYSFEGKLYDLDQYLWWPEHYPEYYALAEDSTLLKTLVPFSPKEYEKPVPERKFFPGDIVKWAQTKHLEIPRELQPILDEANSAETTSPALARAEKKAATRRRNEWLQYDAERLAQQTPAWTKSKIANELCKAGNYGIVNAATIERIIRKPTA